MRSTIVSIVLILFGKNVNAMKCGQNRDTNAGFRIVGGKEASKNDVPWQTSVIVNGDNHICGGSIIAPNCVLTAAHCLHKYHNKTSVKVRVVAGSLVRKKGYKVGQYLEVQKMYLHPNWNAKTSAGDIALMKLK
ncbi:transmembrane protease serine 2-like protein, partial [Leptotrombidium deliense]